MRFSSLPLLTLSSCALLRRETEFRSLPRKGCIVVKLIVANIGEWIDSFTVSEIDYDRLLCMKTDDSIVLSDGSKVTCLGDTFWLALPSGRTIQFSYSDLLNAS